MFEEGERGAGERAIKKDNGMIKYTGWRIKINNGNNTGVYKHTLAHS